MDKTPKEQSLDICREILEGHNYTFHMFRRLFESAIRDNDELIDFWYRKGDYFKNMRLYKYITELGYRKVGTVLKKVK